MNKENASYTVRVRSNVSGRGVVGIYGSSQFDETWSGTDDTTSTHYDTSYTLAIEIRNVTGYTASYAVAGTNVTSLSGPYSMSGGIYYTFKITGNATIFVYYEEIITRYTVTLHSSPSSAGTLSGGGTYASGSIVNVNTEPTSSDWVFDYWLNGGGSIHSYNKNFTINGLYANQDYTAVYHSRPKGTLHLTATTGGRVSGGGTYYVGTNVTITATSNEGYEFVHWLDDVGGVYSTDARTTFTINAEYDYYLTAVFRLIPTGTLTLSASPSSGGNVRQEGSGTYPVGTNVAIHAVANTGYQFLLWADDSGGTYSTQADTTIRINAEYDYYLTAFFTSISDISSFSIKAIASDGSSINVSGYVNSLELSSMYFSWSGRTYTTGDMLNGRVQVTYNIPSGYYLREIRNDSGNINPWVISGGSATSTLGGDASVTLIFAPISAVIERTSATYPTDIKSSPFYIGTEKDGYNKYNGVYNPLDTPEIKGNCTWYANGRTQEIAGRNLGTELPNLGNAGKWFSTIPSTWSKEGNDKPLEGAGNRLNVYPGDIVCWTKVDSNGNPIVNEKGQRTYEGHVEIIEKIENGIATISYSDYNLKFFGTYTETVSTYFKVNTSYSASRSATGQPINNLKLQGVIHNAYRTTPTDLFYVIARPNDSEYGSIVVQGETGSGTGPYQRGEIVTIHAYPNPGFEFLNWSIGGENPQSFPIYGDMYITANFDVEGSRITKLVMAMMLGAAPDLITKAVLLIK